ncbi:hypothetical protein ACSV9I_07040 [Rhizobium sp. G187]|uniref:hypothetical protein n=1 Tax=Rhizobium sp. G187 TaxID=3451352 RepID=UPI003EE615F4
MVQLELDVLAREILTHQSFMRSVAALCIHLPELFKADTRLVRAIGDFGAFSIVMRATAIATSENGTFTLAAVQAGIVRLGWASQRRVRALVEWLEWAGCARQVLPSADLRKRPWSITGWLETGIHKLAEIYLAVTYPWRGDRVPATVATELSMFVGSFDQLMHSAGRRLLFSAEIRLFSNHAAGFPILLDLLRACMEANWPSAGVLFSRKALAKAYNISRAHVTKILAKAERLGMVHRQDAFVAIARSAKSNVLRDIAYQFALVTTAMTT